MALLYMTGQPTNPRTPWRRNLVRAVVVATAAAATLMSIPVVFGTPQPQVHIRWRSISDEDRVARERRFGLTEPARLDGGEWSYVPTDTSPERLLAILTDPAVADTNGINPRTFAIAETPPLTERRGGLLDAPPWMSRIVRVLAYLLALIATLSFVRAAATSPALQRGSRIRHSTDSLIGAGARVVPALRVLLRARAASGAAPLSVMAAAVGVFAATLAWRFLTFTGFTNDHYVHLALAQQLLLGDRPIRDFADSGWPLMYLLSAAAWRLSGDTLAVEWSIAAGSFAIGAACTIVAAYRLSGSLVIGLLVTIFEVLIYPRTYSYPKVLAYAAASCAVIAMARRPSNGRILIMAAVVAVSFLLRHDHGLFIGIAAAVSLASASFRAGWRAAARRMATLAATSTALLVPWATFIAFNGGLVEYFEGGIEYSRAEVDATALAAPPVIDPAMPFLAIRNTEAWLFWLFWSLPILCGVLFVIRAVRKRERWPGESAAMAGIVTLAILVNASFLRQALQVRLPDAVVPAALLGAWALGLCWTGRWRIRSFQMGTRFVTAAVFVVSFAAIGRIADLSGLYDNTDIGRGPTRTLEHAREVSDLLRSRHRDNLTPPSRVSRALMPFMSYVERCTSPSERLIVTGEFPELLVIAGRRFAGDGVVFGSWYASVAHQTRTVMQLEASPPLFVIHAGDYSGFRGRFEQVDAFVNRTFKEIAEIPVEGTASIRILVNRNRIPNGTDRQTGWSCYRDILEQGRAHS